jgi:hypothetical protein
MAKIFLTGAGLADAQETHLVFDDLKPFLLLDSFLQLSDGTFLEVLRTPAGLADQMVVMLPVLIGKLVSLTVVESVDLGENAKAAKSFHRSVDRGEMDPLFIQTLLDFRHRQRPLLSRKNLHDLLPGLGPPETSFRQGLLKHFELSVHRNLMRTICKITGESVTVKPGGRSKEVFFQSTPGRFGPFLRGGLLGKEEPQLRMARNRLRHA